MGADSSNILQALAITGPAVGGVVQARGIRQQARAEESAALRNARLAELEGALAGKKIRREGRRAISSARTRFAQGGVLLEGSPLNFLVEEAREIDEEARQAELAARNTAALDRSRARSAISAGKRAASSSLLLGATRAASVGANLRRRN